MESLKDKPIAAMSINHTAKPGGHSLTVVLAFVQKPVTVVSSNFISLLAILGISFSIHLIVRYRELLEEDADSCQYDLVLQTKES